MMYCEKLFYHRTGDPLGNEMVYLRGDGLFEKHNGCTVAFQAMAALGSSRAGKMEEEARGGRSVKRYVGRGCAGVA